MKRSLEPLDLTALAQLQLTICHLEGTSAVDPAGMGCQL